MAVDDLPADPANIKLPSLLTKKDLFVPSTRQRELVAMMVANRVSMTIIAMAIGISGKALLKYFAREIKHGRDHMVARVGVGVLRKALRGNMHASRYWLMTHGGPEWRINSKDAAAEAAAFGTPEEREKKRVTFYIPKNGRDRPEAEAPGPVIEGEVEATGTDGT